MMGPPASVTTLFARSMRSATKAGLVTGCSIANSVRASLSVPHAWAVARLGSAASVNGATGSVSHKKKPRPKARP